MKGRKLLSITGAIAVSLTGVSAAATGNLMAPPPKDPPPKTDSPDAGTVPLTKKEPAKKDASKK